MQIGVVAIPPIAEIFDAVPLNFTQWLYTIAISISPIFIMELQKRINEFRFGKVMYKNQRI